MDLKLIRQQLWPQALISPDAESSSKSGFYSPQKFRWPDHSNPERPVQIREVFQLLIPIPKDNRCNGYLMPVPTVSPWATI
jgi:hypothetical protein